MDQLLLARVRGKSAKPSPPNRSGELCGAAGGEVHSWRTKDKKKEAEPVVVPDLLMDGGRKLTYERTFQLGTGSEAEARRSQSKVVDVGIAGAPDMTIWSGRTALRRIRRGQ